MCVYGVCVYIRRQSKRAKKVKSIGVLGRVFVCVLYSIVCLEVNRTHDQHVQMHIKHADQCCVRWGTVFH